MDDLILETDSRVDVLILNVSCILFLQILEDLVDEGKICALGVSNFSKEQIECLTAHARHPVSVQQVECHAYFRQDAMLDFCKNRNIVMMSFASMGSPATSFIE